MSTVSAKNRQVYYLKGKYLLGVADSIRRYDDSSDLEQRRMLAEGDLPYVLVRRGLFGRQKKVLFVPSAINEVANLRVNNLLNVAGLIVGPFVSDDPSDFDEFSPPREFTAGGFGFCVLMVDGQNGMITING